MKSIIKILVLAAIAAFMAISAGAQEFRTSYFIDGSTYRHRINPAFVNESNYINLPFAVISNLNFGINSNFGMGTFLFPGEDGNLVTFMHPSVDPSVFLSGIERNNRINADLGIDILSLGFLGLSKGFNTFEIGIKSNTSVNIPYGLFDFMKNGMSNTTENNYDMSGIGINSNNYLHITYGYSRYIIKDFLSIGAKVRFIAGLANADLQINNLNANISGDKWTIDGSGKLVATVPGAEFTTTTDENGSYINGVDFNKDNILIGQGNILNSLPGYGWSCDFGVYLDLDRFVKGLAFSASVTDIGNITWNNSLSASVANSYEFDGFDQPLGSEGSSLDDEISQIGEDLAKFARLQDDGIIETRTTRLTAKMYIGAEYRLPVYDRLKFGILSTTFFNPLGTWNETRGSVVFSPAGSFDLAASYAYSPLGQSIGWMINVHPNGFNFFVGAEYGLTRMSPQFIPIDNTNLTLNFGLNITWGKKRIAEKLGK